MEEPGFAESLLEQAPDAFLLVAADGTIGFVNAAAEDLFGYRREELLGASHTILFSQDERGGFLRMFVRPGLAGTAARQPFAAVGRHKNGTELALEVTCSLVASLPGPAMAVAIRVDFHGRNADSGRREAVSLLDAALVSTPDGILAVPSDGEVTLVNEQYLKLWGMQPGLLAMENHTALSGFILQLLAHPEVFAPDQARQAMEELAEQAEKLKDLAFRDPLTGLANRVLFHERTAAALLTPQPVEVLLLDLDDFKEVNDVLGHQAGDEMLVEIARRLQDCVGPHGTVARLGGDEFVVLLVGCADPDAVARRVLDTLNTPVSIEGTLLRPDLSLGVASRDGGAVTASELLRQADLAMYAAKEAGKNCYLHFRPAMLTALVERTQLTAGLRRAVELGQITVHYQPVISTKRLDVVQFEALARWERNGQLVAPDSFIQTAERSGLIRDIGAEVLRQSCIGLQPWLAKDPDRALAVNVSGVQLQQPDFAAQVLEIVARSGINPGQLVLEVTESVFFDADCAVLQQFESLRDAGIRVALDDFGTGYSSLGRLQELPVDIVKMDKSFVSMIRTGDEKLPILTSMIHMARSLDLKVTAEGIETLAQARYLMDHECDALQGFLFSRPEPEFQRDLAIDRSIIAIVALTAPGP